MDAGDEGSITLRRSGPDTGLDLRHYEQEVGEVDGSVDDGDDVAAADGVTGGHLDLLDGARLF